MAEVATGNGGVVEDGLEARWQAHGAAWDAARKANDLAAIRAAQVEYVALCRDQAAYSRAEAERKARRQSERRREFETLIAIRPR